MTTAELLKRCRDAGITVPPSGMVRAAAAAQILGVSPKTLEEWRANGKLKNASRLNRTVFYDIADIAALFG